jgi:hypothetical protein
LRRHRALDAGAGIEIVELPIRMYVMRTDHGVGPPSART